MGFLVKGCTRDRHFPGGSAGRVRLLCRRPWFDPWVEKIPWRRDRLPIPVFMDFPGGSDGKQSSCNVGNLGSIPGLGRSPGGGHGNSLQYSCLENPHGQRTGRLQSMGLQRVRHDFCIRKHPSQHPFFSSSTSLAGPVMKAWDSPSL